MDQLLVEIGPEPRQLVLKLKLASLEFGHFAVIARRVVQGLVDLALERVVLAFQLGHVVLHRHATCLLG